MSMCKKHISLYLSSVVMFVMLSHHIVAEEYPTLETLMQQVSALPEDSQSSRLKKAVLELALENVGKLAEGGDSRGAEALVVDIDDALKRSAGSLNLVPENILPRIPEWDGNPYVEHELDRLKSELSRGDRVVYLGQRGAKQFAGKPTGDSDSYNPRVFAAEIRNYAWAGLHPQSPYHGNTEILKRALRRAHAYVDAYTRTDITLEDMSVNDFFACYSFLDGLLTLKSGAWEFVLPSQREQWRAATQKARTAWLSYVDKEGGWWDGVSNGGFGSFCNHHITKGMIIQFAGLILEDSNHADIAKRVIAMQKIALLPDGGIRYIGKQNEIYGYHQVNIEKLVRHWELTGDPTAFEILASSRNYYPLSTEPGNVAEYWTPPYWKYQWHGSSFGIGAEIIAGMVGCGYNRMIAQQNLEYGNPESYNHKSKNIIAAPYYRSGLEVKERLDDFIVYDKNLMSPRGRFGPFSFVGTTRDYGEHPGKMSFMGCMVTDASEREHPLNAALKAVYPKVLIDSDLPNWQGSAYLSYREKNSTTVGQAFGSLTTSYDMLMTTFGHAITPVDWSADQQWLCFPDRIIGSIAVYPKTSQQKALGVSGHVRLGYGLDRKNKKEMQSMGAGLYGYGKLRIQLHDHNYEEISVEESGMLRDGRRLATEIVFRDQRQGEASSLVEYSRENPYCFTVEIRPSWALPATEVEPFREGDFSGLYIELKGEFFLLVHNRSSQEKVFSLDREAWSTTKQGALYRSSHGEQAVPVLVDEVSELSVPEFSHQVLVSGSEPRALEPGLYSFDELLR